MTRGREWMRRSIAPSPAQPSGPAGGPITAQNTINRPNYGPPSNIGRDRAGGYGTDNDLRQLFPTATGRNLADLFSGSGTKRLGDFPGSQARPKYPGHERDLLWRRGPSTTVPEGFNDPDRFGRMRPTQANNPYAGRINNNPMGGANIGGGWNQYEGAPERGWEYLLNRDGRSNVTPMSSGSYLSSKYGGPNINKPFEGIPPFSPGPLNPGTPEFDMAGGPRVKPLTVETPELDLLDMMQDETFDPDFNQDEYYSDGWDTADVGDEYRMWNSIRRKYGADVADQMMGGNVAVNRGGIMGLI